MAKDKAKTGGGGAKNNHNARIAYLHRAATYLSSIQTDSTATSSGNYSISNGGRKWPAADQPARSRPVHFVSLGLPLYLAGHLTQVARKTQIRLQPDVKHGICKRCNNVLIDGSTSTKTMQNPSKAGKKSHASLLVIECNYCGAQKRFPVGAQRQKTKSARRSMNESSNDDASVNAGVTE